MNKKNYRNIFPEKMVTSLAYIFTMEKLVVKIIFGVKDLFVNLCAAFFTTFGKLERMVRALFSVKFWNDLLGLAKGKELTTNTQLQIIPGI